MFSHKILNSILWVCLVFMAGSASLFAEAGYDPYTSEMAYAPENSTLKKAAAEFLTYPLELVRWPVNKTLVFLEEERIPAKTKYIYEKFEDNGITPVTRFSVQGAEVDLPKMVRMDDDIPWLTAKGWVLYGHERIFDTGARLGYERPEETGFHTFGTFRYERRPEENFYGIGPDTSAGDETKYKMTTSSIEGRAGYALENSLRMDAVAAYKNIDIENGPDDDPHLFDYSYNNQTIPGIGGDHIISFGTDLSFDPLAENDLTSPGKIKVGASYNEGVAESNARFFKLVTDLRKNIQLGSPRRVLALRFYGEHNNHLNNHNTPFHQMAKLGGFGVYPFFSNTMRGYSNNRFTGENAALLNLEYRYRVLENRDWTLTQVFFMDAGQTFETFGRFQFQDFRESYGTGFRLGYVERVVLDLEMAHGDEGTVFYVKNRQPF